MPRVTLSRDRRFSLIHMAKLKRTARKEPAPSTDLGVRAAWLYHVEGGGDLLSGDCERLLIGRAIAY